MTTGNYKLFSEWEHLRWKDECICDCWNITYVRRLYLTSWRVQSCWCFRDELRPKLHTKHSDCKTRFYKIRWWMLSRCRNKKWNRRMRYWWRWITVCDRWKDYKNFKKDMFDKYNEFVKIHWERNTTIDRINNNKWYYKKNCRRATYKEQANNKGNIIFKHNNNGNCNKS